MKPAYFVCVALLGISAIAQSAPVSPTYGPNPPTGSRQGQAHTNKTLGQFFRPARTASLPPDLNFSTAVPYDSGGVNARSVAVADLNGDGKPDVVVTNAYASSSNTSNGSVSILLGNGDGTFQAPTSYNSGGDVASSVAIADVNGDGKLDLLVTNYCGDCTNRIGAVAVLLGNGDGTFQTAVPYGTGGYQATSVAVADVNGDGKLDLLVANYCDTYSDCNYGSTNPTPGTVAVLLGNGDGTFQSPVTYSTGSFGADSVSVGDVNGDGKPDLAVANLCEWDFLQDQCVTAGSVGVLLGNGDGTFQAVVSYASSGVLTESVAVGDLNGDGKPDLVVVSECNNDCQFYTGVVAVLLGNGDGTFQKSFAYDLLDVEPTSVVIGDVNGDGKPDVVVTNYSGGLNTVGVLLGNGDGTLQTIVNYNSAGYYPFSVTVGDINGDNKPDIVVANYCGSVPPPPYCSTGTSTGSLGVLLNTSTSPTTTALASTPNPSNSGQTVTFTATITAQYAFGNTAPTGTVNLFDGATNLGSSSLNSTGIATFSISTLTVGTHSITATYNGDSNFSGSTSSVLSQVVQGAIIQLSPTTINFGNQTVGLTQGTGTETVTNTGNISLTITSIAFTGNQATVTILSNTCGAAVAPGGSCAITLNWMPELGALNDSMVLTDNAANSPQSVSLTGTGVQPAVTLSPTSLTFPTQIVFTTSKVQTVTLTNTGLGILSISKIATTGPFKQTNTCSSTVNPGNTCTLSVTFTPTKSGSLTGSVSITDNAPGSPQKVSLKGTGTDIQLTPTSLNFGNQPVGTKSLPKKITLSNKASVTVSITSISIVGTDASDFAQTNTCGTSVAGGASCFITVTFTPSAKGTRSASVSISDNGGGSPQKVSLKGTGT